VLPSGLAIDFPDIRLPLSNDGKNVTAIMTSENVRKCMALVRRDSDLRP